MFRKIISWLLAVLMIALCVAGATAEETAGKYDALERYDISISAFGIEEGYDYQQDEIVQFYQDNFNININLIPVSQSNWSEQEKVWITSGDMPDVHFGTMEIANYYNYVRQGLLRELPQDLDTNYPLLSEADRKTGIAAFLMSKLEGKRYCLPKPVFYDVPAEPLTTHLTLWYRKDWADKVGIQVGDTITLEEVEALSRAFITEDPDENGPGNTVGIVSSTNQMFWGIMPSFTPYYGSFARIGDEYVYGPSLPETLDGLKYMQKLYDEGIIYKDFYTMISEADYLQFFYAGKSGMMFNSTSYFYVPKTYTEFEQANPGLSAEDCLGITNIVADDGKFHDTESMNYWASNYFNPSLTDDELYRILDMMEHVTTPEGQLLANLGFEGKDYVIENDEIVITRPKNDAGAYVLMSDLYKSYMHWNCFTILLDNFDVNNPSIPAEQRAIVNNNYRIHSEGVITPIDYDMSTYSSPIYNHFSLDWLDSYIQLIMKDGDLETNWKEWLESNRTTIEETTADINTNLIG